MKFFEVTDKDGDKVMINFDRVEMIYRSDEYTEIIFTGEDCALTVKDDYAKLYNALRAGVIA